MQGTAEYMFVAGLVAGLGIAARQTAGSRTETEKEEWQSLLATLGDVGTIVQTIAGSEPSNARDVLADAQERLETALENYDPTREAIQIGLSGRSDRQSQMGKTQVESDQAVLLNVMWQLPGVDVRRQAADDEDKSRVEGVTPPKAGQTRE